MKIICISQVYWPDNVAVAQHLYDLLKLLSTRNHEVTIITSRHNYEHPEIIYPARECCERVHIHRLPNTGFGKQTKLGRLVDFLSFNFLIAWKLLFIGRKSCDVMIGLTSPPLLSYIGIKIARMKKMRFVYWTMDLQPELSVVAGYMKEGSSMAQTIQKRGDYIFRHADRIIVLDKYMKEHICRRLHSDRKGIDVIPVWPVMESVYEGKREDNPFRQENGFGDRIVIMYSGNHSVMHPLTTLLETAVRLSDDKRFLFVHIGGGVRLQEVREYKEEYGLDNVMILPYQPRERIHLSLGSADIQVVSLGEGCVGYTHPNKVYGAMFIGKPILYIGPEKSHISDILNVCKGNIAVCHEESELLAEKLLAFAGLSESQKNAIGLCNKTFAEQHFHPDVLLDQMIRSVESVEDL